MTPVRLEPAASRSRVKHSTIEALPDKHNTGPVWVRYVTLILGVGGRVLYTTHIHATCRNHMMVI